MRPLIAVVGRLTPKAERVRAEALALGRKYVRALRRAGGQEAIVMPVEEGFDDLPRTIRRFDGVLLCGGGDVDPVHYGARERSRHLYDVDPVADRYEMALLRAAVDAELPVLAICRGMQLLNVTFGGTLHQHLPDLPWRMNHRYELHAVELEAGTRTAAAMGIDRAVGHSVHHQGVDRVGDGLVVAGTAPDGTVEALELPTGWVVGVQWHPEDTAPDDPANHALFTSLVSRACERADTSWKRSPAGSEEFRSRP